jgi:hypothetical protein
MYQFSPLRVTDSKGKSSLFIFTSLKLGARPCALVPKLLILFNYAETGVMV